MIALDTNVLVRFIVDDDPEQSRRAKRLIDEQVEAGLSCFVPDLALAELVWVLDVSYKIPRPKIAGILAALVAARQLSFEASDRLMRAIRAYASGQGDFADYLMREQVKAAECLALATFDADLHDDEMFMAVPE